MTCVRFFGNLRTFVGAECHEVTGATVGLALNLLCEQHEGLRKALFSRKRLRPYVRVMVNGHDIELQQGLDTPLKMQDEVAVFPPMAGG